MDKAEQTADIARLRLGITLNHRKEDGAESWAGRRQAAMNYFLKVTKRVLK